jgi:hypothetical protein
MAARLPSSPKVQHNSPIAKAIKIEERPPRKIFKADLRDCELPKSVEMACEINEKTPTLSLLQTPQK